MVLRSKKLISCYFFIVASQLAYIAEKCSKMSKYLMANAEFLPKNDFRVKTNNKKIGILKFIVCIALSR